MFSVNPGHDLISIHRWRLFPFIYTTNSHGGHINMTISYFSFQIYVVLSRTKEINILKKETHSNFTHFYILFTHRHNIHFYFISIINLKISNSEKHDSKWISMKVRATLPHMAVYLRALVNHTLTQSILKATKLMHLCLRLYRTQPVIATLAICYTFQHS